MTPHQSPLALSIVATLALTVAQAQAAFVISFDAPTLSLNSFVPTGTVNIVATNTGPAADDLLFFTINLAPVSGSSEISVDPPATVSHFGAPFFGGAGLPASSSATIGSFSFTLSPTTTSTVEAPISTEFGGNFFYQATSDLTVVGMDAVSYTVAAVPEASSSVLMAAFAAFGLLRRKR